MTALMALAQPQSGWSQTRSPAGAYVEVEAQGVFGASDVEVGYRPSLSGPTIGSPMDLEEGNGWGGAFAIGYAWQNGWKAAARYRRLDADEKGGPVSPGIIAFVPGISFGIPGGPDGIPLGFSDTLTSVESRTTFVEFEAGKDVDFAGAQLHVFGGLTYASIERDVALEEPGCGCLFALLMANDFHGFGPKVGMRGSVPVSNGISLVGGASVAILFGTSTFESQLSLPAVPSKFKDKDDRTVAAINGEAGLAFAVGPGALTVGYRVDAMLDALDTDQRVPDEFVAVGLPSIGDKQSDYVVHGPFARFAIPLGGFAD